MDIFIAIFLVVCSTLLTLAVQSRGKNVARKNKDVKTKFSKKVKNILYWTIYITNRNLYILDHIHYKQKSIYIGPYTLQTEIYEKYDWAFYFKIKFNHILM